MISFLRFKNNIISISIYGKHIQCLLPINFQSSASSLPLKYPDHQLTSARQGRAFFGPSSPTASRPAAASRPAQPEAGLQKKK